MEDPFANLGGAQSNDSATGDPFAGLGEPSSARRQRRMAIAVAMVAVVLLALVGVWSYLSGLPHQPPVAVQATTDLVGELTDLGDDLADSQGSTDPVTVASASAAGLNPTSDGSPQGDAVEPDTQDMAGALAQLSTLVVAEPISSAIPEGLMAAASEPSGSCSTRQTVLAQEAVDGVVSGCSVQGGNWTSLYDGRAGMAEGDLVVDLVVPVTAAWASGAANWDRTQVDAYLNDVSLPDTLIAVSSASAVDKNGQPINEWVPPDPAFRCEYAARWVRVKTSWQLTVSSAERSLLSDILGTCTQGAGGVSTESTTAGEVDPDAGSDADATASAGTVLPPDPVPPADQGGARDPRFDSCDAAQASGYGNYTRGLDPEYQWYQDRDGDGHVCEY